MGERIPYVPSDDTVRHIDFAKEKPEDTTPVDLTKPQAELEPASTADVVKVDEPTDVAENEHIQEEPAQKRSSSKMALLAMIPIGAAFFMMNNNESEQSETCTREYPDFRSLAVSGVQLGDLEGKHGNDAKAKTLEEIRSHFGTRVQDNKTLTPALTEWSVLIHSEGTANDPADVKTALTGILQSDLGVQKEAITTVEAPALDPKNAQVAVGTLAVWQQMSQQVACQQD